MNVITTESTHEQALLFLKELKSSTQEQHRLLESNILLSAIVSPEVTLRQYYTYLQLMGQIEHVLELQLLPEARSILPLPELNNCLLIKHDLRDINYACPGLPIKTFGLPAGDLSVSFSLAFIYVMRGSKLGGKYIFRNLQRHLGLSEDCGAQYISDFGVDTMGVWREFLSLFSTYTVEHKCETEAIEAVKSVFLSVYHYFESNKSLYEV